MEKQATNRRVPRVEREMREVIANYLLTGLSQALPGLVSVTRVMAAKDLRQARVLVSVLDFDGETSPALQKKTLELLQAMAPELQHEVNARLRMKYCPRLQIQIDRSMENVLKVESILRGIEQSRQVVASAGSGGNAPT